MTATPRNTPRISATRITSTSGACHCTPKNRCRVTGSWLFSAKANKAKKMAALSSHIRYFKSSPLWWDDCSEQGAWSDRLVRCTRQDLGGPGVHLFAQGLSRPEMGGTFF